MGKCSPLEPEISRRQGSVGSLRAGSCWRKARKKEEGEGREVGGKVGVPWHPDSGPDGGRPSGRTSPS